MKPKKIRGRPAGPGRPLIGNRKRVRVSFTLHPDYARWLRERAAAEEGSMSEALDRVIAQAIRRGPPPREKRRRVRISLPERKLEEFCIRHRIKKLALFGSVLTRRFGPDSDVDVLVEFEPGAEPGFFQLAAMEEECGELLGGRKADMRSRGELSRFFRDEVVSGAEVIYGA